MSSKNIAESGKKIAWTKGRRPSTCSTPTPSGGGSVGHVLDLIRRAGGLTRAEIIEKTGLSRSTVAARLEALQTAGWVSSDQATAARGRPPSHFHFRADQGALLIVDAGATGVRTAITDLHGRIEHELRSPLDITVGPQPWLTAVDALFDELLGKRKRVSRIRQRHRTCGARPRGLRECDGGQPADHDGLGRLPDPVLVRQTVRLSGTGRQRRQRDDSRRAHPRTIRNAIRW